VRLIVSILSKEYQRNIIDSGSLDDLARIHQIDFVTPVGVNLALPPHLGNCKIYKFSLDAKSEHRAGFKFEIDARNKRHLSRSFKYRSARKYSTVFFFIIRELGFEYKFVDVNPRNILKSLKNAFVLLGRLRKLRLRKFCVEIYYFSRNKVRQFFVYTLGSRLLFSMFAFFYDKQNVVNKELMNVMNWKEYDFIVHVSSAHEKTGNDLVKIGKQNLVPVVFVIDNWDNLSSKSILSELPDYLIVWGEQSKRHAIDIQGFIASRVFNLGSARFQEYFTARNHNLTSHFNYPYAIFAGTFLPFDEISNLKLIDFEIESNKNIYGDFRIVYRPHPANISNLIAKFYESDFINVVLDPQIMQYSNPSPCQFKENIDLLKLDYYPSFIKNSMFIVGGLTSFLIEASVFSKEYLTLVYSEPLSINSPRRVFREYMHFKEVRSLPNVIFVNKRRDLAKSFRDTFQSPQSLSRGDVDASLVDFLEINEKTTYGMRLRQQLELLYERHLIDAGQR
jgi:hypothetical protein